jgi:hypothetical protein
MKQFASYPQAGADGCREGDREAPQLSLSIKLAILIGG